MMMAVYFYFWEGAWRANITVDSESNRIEFRSPVSRTYKLPPVQPAPLALELPEDFDNLARDIVRALAEVL